jgi:hypothetical protein
MQDYSVGLQGMQAVTLVKDVAELWGSMAVLIDGPCAVLRARNGSIHVLAAAP